MKTASHLVSEFGRNSSQTMGNFEQLLKIMGHLWSLSLTQIKALLLYVLFCVIPRRLNFICRRFGTST